MLVPGPPLLKARWVAPAQDPAFAVQGFWSGSTYLLHQVVGDVM